MNCAFSIDDVDVCVVCVADHAPKLPLREELPSLGVELVYAARGNALKISQDKSRQELKSYREAKAFEDLTSRRLFKESEANAQAALEERRRKEHELKTVHALTYEMYKDRLRNHTQYSEWESSSDSSASELEEMNAPISYAESREEEGSSGESTEIPTDDYGASKGRMSPPPIKGRVSEMIHLYGSISPVSSNADPADSPTLAPKETTDTARSTFVTKRYRNKIKELTADPIPANNEENEQNELNTDESDSKEANSLDKDEIIPKADKPLDTDEHNEARNKEEHDTTPNIKSSAEPAPRGRSRVKHERINKNQMPPSTSKNTTSGQEPKEAVQEETQIHSFQRIKLRSVKEKIDFTKKTEDTAPDQSLDKKEMHGKDRPEQSASQDKPVESIEFPKKGHVRTAQGSRVAQLSEMYGAKSSTSPSHSLGQNSASSQISQKTSPKQFDSLRESAPEGTINRAPTRSFKPAPRTSSIKKEKDVPETLFMPRLRKTGRVAQMVEKYSAAQVADSNEKSFSPM